MLITKLRVKNWRNFRHAEANLRERVYVIGPNASGKSNLLDVLRFLRDIAKAEGGGLQKAVKERGGLKKIRCLAARRDTEILIELDIAEAADAAPVWRYTLALKSEGTGLQRVRVSQEVVVDLKDNRKIVDRPNREDHNDPELLTQTFLEQISANKDFREIAWFLGSVTYLHLVPQLLKFSEQLGGYKLESDPFGQAFLERVAKTQDRARDARLRRIEAALRACVPNMNDLRFVRDENGVPHLEALYKHWRPDAGWQREDQFSDGTLRLLGIMWSLLDGDSLLLLEEPELSLNESIVRMIHPLITQMQRAAKHRRQVFVTTHSEALLSDRSLDPREVVRLEPSTAGTKLLAFSEKETQLIEAGYTVGELVLPKVRPHGVDQMLLFSK